VLLIADIVSTDDELQSIHLDEDCSLDAPELQGVASVQLPSSLIEEGYSSSLGAEAHENTYASPSSQTADRSYAVVASLCAELEELWKDHSGFAAEVAAKDSANRIETDRLLRELEGERAALTGLSDKLSIAIGRADDLATDMEAWKAQASSERMQKEILEKALHEMLEKLQLVAHVAQGERAALEEAVLR